MEKIYLVLPPDTAGDTFGLPAAHMAYRIADNGRLYRANGASETGGLMYIDDDGGFRSNPQLGADIVRECAAKRFTGVVFDLTVGADIASAAALCREKGLTVFVPPCLSHIAGSVVMISTFVTSGSLSATMTDAVNEYGRERTAMMIDLRRADCPVPAGEDDMRELTADELTAMMNRHRSPSFWSDELCANYFTYRAGRSHHIVLYDNSVSVRRILRLADRLGIGTAFLYYPHVKGILSEIIN